nr:hypothetical protein CFP56_50895 [Quercus suber]
MTLNLPPGLSWHAYLSSIPYRVPPRAVEKGHALALEFLHQCLGNFTWRLDLATHFRIDSIVRTRDLVETLRRAQSADDTNDHTRFYEICIPNNKVVIRKSHGEESMQPGGESVHSRSPSALSISTFHSTTNSLLQNITKPNHCSIVPQTQMHSHRILPQAHSNTMAPLPWQIRNLHPTRHSDPRKRARRRWSPLLLHALWGMQLGVSVLLLRALLPLWRRLDECTREFESSEQEDAWREIRGTLRFRWGCFAVSMALTGLVTVAEMVAKSRCAGRLWRMVLWTSLGKAVVNGWLLRKAFGLWQERERARMIAMERYWLQIREDPGLTMEAKHALLQPGMVIRSKVGGVWSGQWSRIECRLMFGQALDVYPRGIDQWIWTALALPTFLAVLPAALITYTRWLMAKEQRAQKGAADARRSTTRAEGLDDATELTLCLNPRESVRTRQSVFA